MTARDRRGWLIVAALFVTLFVVFGGGYNTAGVFFDPMRKQFGWSSARQSSLQTILALTAGVTVPLFGWLLDKIEARLIMSFGIVVAGCAMILASRANSFDVLTIAYVGLGIAIASATLLPTQVVIANWFSQRRGLALGIATSGTSIGGMVMTMAVAHAVAATGWRTGFLVLAIPIFFIAAPLVMLTVRTHPPGDQDPAPGSANPLAAGLELGPALHSRSFWMIAAAQFCYSFAGAGATVLTVPYLIHMGFQADSAAKIFSITFGLASAGKFLMGYSADLISGRVALALTLAIGAIGQIFLLGAQGTPFLVAYIVLFGIMSGAPLALIPMVIAESFGLKRLGSITGLTGICITLGAASGPLVGGAIFDSGLQHGIAFVLYTGALAIGSIAALACSPLEPMPASSNV